MESVKYFDPAEGGGVVEADGQGCYVSAEDFDRVAAENRALQQRLTVQDQREDDLKGLIKEALAELQEMKKSVGFRGYTLALIGLLEAALNPTAEAASHE